MILAVNHRTEIRLEELLYRIRRGIMDEELCTKHFKDIFQVKIKHCCYDML